MASKKQQHSRKEEPIMNSILLQAPGKLKAPQAEGTNLPARSIKKIWLGLATMLLLTAAGLAQNNINGPATNNNAAVIVDTKSQSLFRPRGIIKAMVPNPAAPGGVSWNWWVSDGASGFCRVIPDAATGLLTRDLNNCDLPGVSEPADYQAETFGVNGSNGYAFVAGITSIERVQFIVDPANPAWTVIKDEVPGVVGSRVFIYNGSPKNPGPISIFANGLPAGGNRNIEAARLGPDGKLYFIMQGSGDIWRVRNPLVPAMSPQSNIVERVGTSDNGKTLLSIGFVGNDLWMQQAGFLNKLSNAPKCNYTADCVALLEFGKLQTQEGMATDQFNSKVADGRYLYWFNGNRVVRYDTQSTIDMRVWAHQGLIVDQGATPGQPVPAAFTLGMGLNFIQPALPAFPPTGSPALDAMRPLKTITDLHGVTSNISDMTLCMDRNLEAPPVGAAGQLPRDGRCYELPPVATTVTVKGAPMTAGVLTTDECQPSGLPVPLLGTPGTKLTPAQVIENMTCVITSQIGNDNNVTNQQQAAARRAVLLVSGVTHPRGLVYLKTNFWVSDEQLGFCKIAINPADGSGSLTNCFQSTPTFLPGQPAVDPVANADGTLNVYVPDASAPGRGIVRLVFTPDAAGGTVSQTGSLTAGPRTAYAVAMPNSVGVSNDGSVYIGYSDQATINKIKTPATSPSAPVAVGAASGIGVLTMAFNGKDLYLGELAPQVNLNGQFAVGGQVTVLLSASPDLQRGGAMVVKKALSRLQSPLGGLAPQLFVNPGAVAIGPALDREKCLPPVGVALSPAIGDPLTAWALYLGSMGSNPNDTGTLTVPEVDQFGSLCTTQIPWVEEASLDALHTINVQLGPVTAIAFSNNSSTAVMAIGDDPTTLPLDNLSAQKSGFKPPTTNGIGQGHVYIVP
jgi:hypothetical protein